MKSKMTGSGEGGRILINESVWVREYKNGRKSYQ